jgi:soluble lytic murein transglycosylase
MYYLCIQENAKYNPYARSSKNAIGIMQIRIITFREYIRVKKITNKYTDGKIYKLLINPKINIKIGCWYMRKLLNDCNGNYVTALSHYNTGANSENYNLDYVNNIFMKCLRQ